MGFLAWLFTAAITWVALKCSKPGADPKRADAIDLGMVMALGFRKLTRWISHAATLRTSALEVNS